MRITPEISDDKAMQNRLRNQRNIAMQMLQKISNAAHAPAKQLRIMAQEGWENAASGGIEDENG